ncbi:Purple acid phosphatase 7, partial [Durusdinium trenchii]
MASSSQGGQGRGAPVLKSAAEAVAKSLASGRARAGAPLEVTRQLMQLKDVLLAEHADASPGAKERCQSLRSSFALALRSSLQQTEEGKTLLVAPPRPPKVRVEVRHTAGRVMLSEVFTVGRAAECDVQTTGDATASRLQFLVISLPQGLCIADAWSGGGTRVVRREAPNEALPASLPHHRAAFLLPHGERVTLMTGARTTVTLGPAVKELQAQTNGHSVPRVPTVKLVEEAKAKAAAAAAMPKAAGAPHSAAPSTRPSAAPAPAVLQAPPSPTSPCAEICSKAINCMRSNMRAQQQTVLRERLKGRMAAAQRLKLLAKLQLAVFQERLAGPAESIEDLRDFLDGLGVPLAPDDPATVTWTCGICKVKQKCRGFR